LFPCCFCSVVAAFICLFCIFKTYSTSTVAITTLWIYGICVFVCMYVCMYVYMYVCTYVRTYVCMYVCMYVRTYVRTYKCMYECMCVCIYVYTSFVCCKINFYYLTRNSYKVVFILEQYEQKLDSPDNFQRSPLILNFVKIRSEV
jgi:hypothetical protein